jgi:hypothetical protein
LIDPSGFFLVSFFASAVSSSKVFGGAAIPAAFSSAVL